VWAWDEQRLAPPLGHGNGLMVWPYRDSLHFMQDQCLSMEEGKVPNLRNLFREYHHNITTKLPWWREEIAPRIKLRARMFEGFEIYVGLDERLREMPNHTDGMILIGDAAGLENTELCDGVPTAWFSAEIAADVAIEALRAGDTSRSFLKRYDNRVKDHPIIQWEITGTNRFNLRYAQEDHDLEKLRKHVHDGWGLGAFTHASTPLVRMILRCIRQDPTVITAWIRMFFRYYYNWLYERYDYSGGKPGPERDRDNEPRAAQEAFRITMEVADMLLKLSAPLLKPAARMLEPLADLANPAMKLLLPLVEALMKGLRELEPVTSPLADKLVDFVRRADPHVFDPPSEGGCRDA